MAKQYLLSDAAMSALVATIGRDPEKGMDELTTLLADFPRDPRLHFLNGSLLAGAEDFAAARTAMRRAVDLAPDFAVARFQLGFLLLTSAEPYPAQEAWGPLYNLPPDNYIRLFVEGLNHLIRDEFDATIRLLEQGIANNVENAPMNRDMQMVIDEIRSRGDQQSRSPVDFLLQQSALRSRH